MNIGATEPEGGKVPVMACVKDAWRFALKDGLRVAPAALVVAIASALSVLFMASSAAGSVAPYLLAFPLNLFAGAIFAAAVLRRAVRGEAGPRLGLAFGADEVRLVAVAAVLALVFIPFGAVVFVVISYIALGRVTFSFAEMDALMSDPDALSERISSSLGSGGELAFTLFVFVVVGLVIVLSIRLFVANAATIGERRVVVFQVWRWSRGNVMRVFLAMLLTAAPAFLIGGIISSIIETPLKGVDPATLPAMTIVLVSAGSGFVSAVMNIPSLALGAILYRGLRPADSESR